MKELIKKLRTHEGLNKYLRNTAWMLLEKFFRLALGASIGIWVARYLGPSNFGRLNYAYSFSSFFIVLSGLGLHALVIRELSNKRTDNNSILGSAFALHLLGTSLSFALAYIVTIAIGETKESQTLILVMVATIIPYCFNPISYYFHHKVMSKYIALSQIFGLVFISLMRVYLIIYGYSLIYFGLVLLIEATISAIFMCIFYKRSGGVITAWRLEINRCKQLLRDCLPLLLSALLVIIYMKIDQVMIKRILGAKEAGIFAVAANLSAILYFFPVTISASLFPSILNARHRSKKEYFFRLQRINDFMFLGSIIVTLPIIFFAQDIILLIYDSRFATSANILKVHVLSLFMISFETVKSKWVIAENMQKFVIIAELIGATSNVILNYILIRKYGTVGAAYATLLAQLFTFVLSLLFIKPIRPILYITLNSVLNAFTLQFLRKHYFKPQG